jgi:nucleotide-binding universal stress UspA family protein
MYERILVPIDGSPTSTLGLDEAIRLGKAHGAAILLLHVIDRSRLPFEAGNVSYLKTVMDAVRESAWHLLRSAAGRVRTAGLAAETLLRESDSGRVAEAVIDEARRWPADLIVMGTHGRRGVSHLFLGSDAEAVVRLSPVPVLLVRDIRPVARPEATAVA